MSIENHQGRDLLEPVPRLPDRSDEAGLHRRHQKQFPDFKRTELEVGDAAYAMPWDSVRPWFYRRDFYKNAGIDPASIKTWDDFIAAGKKISAANPGVVMSQADLQRRQRMVPHARQRAGLRLFFGR